MAIADNFEITSSAYVALTTVETWARVSMRTPGRPIRFAVSSGGAPSASTADYCLWQLYDLPFLIEGLDAVLYARADGATVIVDVAAGTP